MKSFAEKAKKSRKPIPFTMDGEVWYVANIPNVETRKLLESFVSTDDKMSDSELEVANEANIQAGGNLIKRMIVDEKGEQFKDLMDMDVSEIDEHLSPRQIEILTKSVMQIIAGENISGN